jgi:hypothetical protein
MNTPINARERLPNLLYDIENPTTIAGFQPQTFIGGAQGAMDLGLGIWGMIKDDDINAPVYESTYQTSAVLPGLRDKAVRDAFVGMDDYAARIRARNNKNDAVNSAIARSGGSRAFVQSNVAAADDVLNLANLSIDKEMEARRVQSMSVAGNLENLVVQDKLNKLKDQQYSYESKYRNHMQEIKLDMENTAGAMSRINSGMGSLAQAGSYEEQWGKNGTQRNMMAANILLALSAAGLDKTLPDPTNKDRIPDYIRNYDIKEDNGGDRRPTNDYKEILGFIDDEDAVKDFYLNRKPITVGKK